MKLFIIVATLAVASAARLEHLERGYLPPNSNSIGNGNGFGGSQGGINGFGAADASAQAGGFNAATVNQYLPPDHEHGQADFSLSNGNSFGTSPSHQNGAPQQRYNQPQQQYQQPQQQYSQPQQQYQQPQQQYSQPQQQYSQPQQQYRQPQQHSQPQQQYGQPQPQYNQPQQPQASFTRSQQHSAPQQQYGARAQFGGASGQFRAQQQGQNQFGSSLGASGRQYLAPKSSSSFQNVPQQSFDEQTGYHY